MTLLLLFGTVSAAHTQTVTDGAGLTDSVSLVHDHAQALTDALGATDALSTVHDHVQSVTDLLGLVDEDVADTDLVLTLSDALGLADDVVGERLGEYDLLGLVDDVSYTLVGIAHEATVTDALGIIDESDDYRHDVDEDITEALGLSDSLAGVEVDTRELVDVVGLTDSVVVEQPGGRTITDNLGLDDDVATGATTTRTITNNLRMRDTRLVGLAQVGPEQTSPMGMVDFLVQAQDSVRSVTDTLGLTDAVEGQGYSREFTDNLGLIDSLVQAATGAVAHAVTISDVLGMIDATGETSIDSPWVPILGGGGTWQPGGGPEGGVWTSIESEAGAWA